jgi:hypothetical protein
MVDAAYMPATLPALDGTAWREGMDSGCELLIGVLLPPEPVHRGSISYFARFVNRGSCLKLQYSGRSGVAQTTCMPRSSVNFVRAVKRF